jgi:hypothetical protein
MTDNLHSPPRRLIELRIEHGDLDGLIDRAALDSPDDDLALRRLKKRRLLLRDQISRLEAELDPPSPHERFAERLAGGRESRIRTWGRPVAGR